MMFYTQFVTNLPWLKTVYDVHRMGTRVAMVPSHPKRLMDSRDDPKGAAWRHANVHGQS